MNVCPPYVSKMVYRVFHVVQKVNTIPLVQPIELELRRLVHLAHVHEFGFETCARPHLGLIVDLGISCLSYRIEVLRLEVVGLVLVGLHLLYQGVDLLVNFLDSLHLPVSLDLDIGFP